jgi:PAS domain S-box-containing protein
MTSGKDHIQENTHPLETLGDRYRELFERAPVGYFVLDRRGKILDVNRTGLVFLSLEKDQVTGKSLADFIDREDAGHFSLHLYEVTKTVQTAVCDLTMVGREGRRSFVELQSSPAMDLTGRHVTGCLSVISDASQRRDRESAMQERFNESERRRQRDAADLARSGSLLQKEVFDHEQTEAVLAQTSALFEKVFSTSYLAIACLDCDFNFLRVNPAFARAYNEGPTFFLDKPYFSLYPDPDLKEEFQKVLDTGEPYSAFARPLVRMQEDNEMTTWWDWNVSTLVGREGEIEGLLLCLLEVSERINLERQVVNITDQEQKRLGQELHDGMGQILTAVSIKTKILEESVRDKLVAQVREVGELVREAAVQTRNISKLLNPRIVEEQGLLPALESLATETQRRLGVPCSFDGDQTLDTHDSVEAAHLYRITQESVTNALRHGPARAIQISYKLEQGDRVLRITNDGQPFNPRDAHKSEGLGVQGMRYRAELIGAVFSIESGAEGGTVVTCTLPKPTVTTEVDADTMA